MTEKTYEGVVEFAETGTTGNRLVIKAHKRSICVVVNTEDPSVVEVIVDGDFYTLERVEDPAEDSDND